MGVMTEFKHDQDKWREGRVTLSVACSVFFLFVKTETAIALIRYEAHPGAKDQLLKHRLSVLYVFMQYSHQKYIVSASSFHVFILLITSLRLTGYEDLMSSLLHQTANEINCT